MAAAALAAGAALLAGVLTPFAALLILLGATGTALSLLPPSILSFTDSRLAAILIAIVAIAIVCLGPGAFSVDARLFGRREVIIPRRSE